MVSKLHLKGIIMTREEMTLLILERLDSARDDISAQWANPVGTSTRHFCLDGVLPASLAEQIYDAFPKDASGFYNQESFREKKKTSAHLSQFDKLLGEITYAFQDRRVVSKIADIVELRDIEPDPALYAGGLSMMFNGDFLNPHIDNSHDAERKRYRRLNILYYVSPDWKLENGGNLELWDEMRTIPKTIVCLRNRLAVMETNKNSWHSVSKVVTDSPRCCVSNYYFSTVSPDESSYFHVTSFTGRPEEKMRKVLGRVDNALRNLASSVFGIGRGKGKVNKKV